MAASAHHPVTVRALGRLLAITDLLRSRRYGLSRKDLMAELEDEYGGLDLAAERKFYRDVRALQELGRVVVLNRGPGSIPTFIAPEFEHLRMEEVDV